MSLETAFSTLETQANDLVRETGNKDAPGSQAAYDAYHETFATNEGMIKEKSESSWQELEDGMHEVRDTIKIADWTAANTASKELVNTIAKAKVVVMSADEPSPFTNNVDMSTFLIIGAAFALVLLAFVLVANLLSARRR